MSELRKITITCLECQTKGEFDEWSSINVDLNPEMRDKVINEEAFKWVCPHCGTKFNVPYTTLYHDMKHKFMLYYFPDKPENSAEKYNITDWPMPIGMCYGYKFRFVYGHTNFSEKIIILERGFNDVAIEKLKYCITHHMDPSMAEKGVKLIYAGLKKPDNEEKYGQMLFFYYIPQTDKNGQLAISMERYYEQCLSIEIDKRFNIDSWCCVDEDWISMKMKGIE